MNTIFETNFDTVLQGFTLENLIQGLIVLAALIFFFGCLYLIHYGIPNLILKRREKKFGKPPLIITKIVEGKIEVLGKDFAHINNGRRFLKYSQLGIYHGDTTGFRKGDKIKCHMKKLSGLECWANKPNIAKIEPILQNGRSVKRE